MHQRNVTEVHHAHLVFRGSTVLKWASNILDSEPLGVVSHKEYEHDVAAFCNIRSFSHAHLRKIFEIFCWAGCAVLQAPCHTSPLLPLELVLLLLIPWLVGSDGKPCWVRRWALTRHLLVHGSRQWGCALPRYQEKKGREWCCLHNKVLCSFGLHMRQYIIPPPTTLLHFCNAK